MMFVRGKYNVSDGLGGLRGSAHYPRNGGDIFFDDEENWYFDSYNNYSYNSIGESNLLIVATHELGHALGLKHSEKTTALMTSKGTDRLIGEVRLDVDDVKAIQALYGAPGIQRPHVEDIEEVDIKTGNRRYADCRL